MVGVKLKNFKKFIGVYLIGLLCVMTGVISCISCTNVNSSDNYDTGITDSLTVASYVESTVNPSFKSVQEVKSFQNRLIEECSIDEIFITMPEKILNDVATVCLNKNGTITKKDIVLEYQTNNSVYDNLITASITQTEHKEDSTSTKTENGDIDINISPITVSYHYELDTIDGKPVKVLVKEERYESK